MYESYQSLENLIGAENYLNNADQSVAETVDLLLQEIQNSNNFMDKKIIKDGYNQISDLYNSRRLEKLVVNSKYFDALSNYFPKNGEFLDLGCGSGIPVMKYFIERGLTGTGIDISEKMIELGKKQVPDGKFICGDMMEHDFADNHFCLIVSTFAIIHVPRQDQFKLLHNIYDWLKKGGVSYLVLGNENIKEEIKENWHGVKMYWSYYTSREYQGMLDKIGFRRIWEAIEDLPNGEQFYNVILKK